MNKAQLVEKVAEKSLAPGDHGTTYGGNPFVGAAVSAVLDIYEEKDILSHVKEVSTYLEGKLDKMSAELREDIIKFINDRSIKQIDLMKRYNISRNTLKKYVERIKTGL